MRKRNQKPEPERIDLLCFGGDVVGEVVIRIAVEEGVTLCVTPASRIKDEWKL